MEERGHGAVSTTTTTPRKEIQRQPRRRRRLRWWVAGRTNDTVSEPRSRRIWRVNQRGNLVRRQRRFRNVCQIEQAEQEPRLIERPYERADKYPRWRFHAKLGR